MAKWFLQLSHTIFRDHGFVHSNLPLPCLGPSRDTTPDSAQGKQEGEGTHIRRGYLDVPDISLYNLFVIAHRLYTEEE
jgi:hypothetical protein